MISEFGNGKYEILTINIFTILLKASTLNPFKLKSDLEEVETTLRKTCDSVICSHALIFIICLLIISKFLAGYITLASNIIAMFPILTDSLPQLLLPLIFAQAIDNVLLKLLEAIIGYFTLYYYAPSVSSKVSVLVIFLTCMTVKISVAIATLNIYSDYYQYLTHSTNNDFYDTDDDASLDSTEKFISVDNAEKFIRSESLS